MSVESRSSPEAEALIGATTLECARWVVDRLPGILHVQLRTFHYVPDTTLLDEPVYQLDRNTFLHGTPVEELAETLPPETNIALDSPVWLSYQEPDDEPAAHFAMMDLAVPKGSKAPEFIRDVLIPRIVPTYGGGFLLETGKSYHFLGMKLLLKDRYYDFLADFILAGPVTRIHEGLPRVHTPVADVRYSAHSIKRRTTGLRLTTKGNKTVEPRVVAVI